MSQGLPGIISHKLSVKINILKLFTKTRKIFLHSDKNLQRDLSRALAWLSHVNVTTFLFRSLKYANVYLSATAGTKWRSRMLNISLGGMTNIVHNELWSVNRAYRRKRDACLSKHVRSTINLTAHNASIIKTHLRSVSRRCLTTLDPMRYNRGIIIKYIFRGSLHSLRSVTTQSTV